MTQLDCLEQAALSLAKANEKIAALTTALSSGMCSEHSHPDPLHCDICNMVSWLHTANTERMEKINLLATTNIQLEAIRLEMETLLREAIGVPCSPGQSIYYWKKKALARFPHLKEP